MRRLLAGLLLLGVTGCSAALPASGYPEIVLEEFGVEAHGVFPIGDVEVLVRNEGEMAHTAVFTDARGSVVAASRLIAPGEEVLVPVTLVSGEYEVSCRVVVESENGQIVDHYEAGMLTSFTSG